MTGKRGQGHFCDIKRTKRQILFCLRENAIKCRQNDSFDPLLNIGNIMIKYNLLYFK